MVASPTATLKDNIITALKRPVPKWIEKELIKIGGYADDGQTPFLRFIHPEDSFIRVFGQYIPRYWETMRKRIVGYSYAVFDKAEQKVVWRRVDTERECLGPFIIHKERSFTVRKHWVLEAWMPPEKYKKDWEAERYLFEDGKMEDVLGEPPPFGGYECIVSLTGKFGTPKDIGQQALNYVKKIWKKMQDDPMWKDHNWREAPTEDMKKRASMEAADEQAAMEKVEADQIHEITKDFFDTAGRLMFNKDGEVSIGSGKVFTGHQPSTGLVDRFGKPLSSSNLISQV